jgi:DNA-binding NtrC family response regulator
LTLANAFLAQYRGHYGRSDAELADDAKAALLAHSWPGNVRELRNVMEQACLIFTGRVIHATDLSLREAAPIRSADGIAPIQGTTLDDVERELIANALRQTSGNVTLAARQLGVSRDTLRYRIEKYALRRDGIAPFA